jgi:hypothetical protein
MNQTNFTVNYKNRVVFNDFVIHDPVISTSTTIQVHICGNAALAS